MGEKLLPGAKFPIFGSLPFKEQNGTSWECSFAMV